MGQIAIECETCEKPTLHDRGRELGPPQADGTSQGHFWVCSECGRENLKPA